MKSIREYIDILTAIQLDESRADRTPSAVTVTTYDKDGNPVSQTTEPPRWKEEKTYVVYEVPNDWQTRGLPSPYSLQLKIYRSGRGERPALYRTLDNKVNPEAERVFGPGKEIAVTVKPGTPGYKFSNPEPTSPKTPFWDRNKKKIRNNP